MAWLALLAQVALLAGVLLLVAIGNGWWGPRCSQAHSEGPTSQAAPPGSRQTDQAPAEQPISTSDELAHAGSQPGGAAGAVQTEAASARQAAQLSLELASQQLQQRSIREVLEEASQALAAADLVQRQHAVPVASAAQRRPSAAAEAEAGPGGGAAALPTGMQTPPAPRTPLFVGAAVSEDSTSNTSLQSMSSLPRRHNDTESLTSTSLAGTSMPDTVSTPALLGCRAWLLAGQPAPDREYRTVVSRQQGPPCCAHPAPAAVELGFSHHLCSRPCRRGRPPQPRLTQLPAAGVHSGAPQTRHGAQAGLGPLRAAACSAGARAGKCPGPLPAACAHAGLVPRHRHASALPCAAWVACCRACTSSAAVGHVAIERARAAQAPSPCKVCGCQVLSDAVSPFMQAQGLLRDTRQLAGEG